MAQYNNLKTAIAAVIKQNGNNEITGDLLQQTLIAIVNGVGLGYQFMGVAIPATNPGTQDARIFYIASQAGQYSNFGGVTLDGNQFAIFLFADNWSSIVLDLPTKTYVDASFVAKAALESGTGQSTETTMTQKAITDALNEKVDNVTGKGLSTNDLTDALKALIEGAFQKLDIVSELGDDATKVLSQAAITVILESYAKINGNYPEMTVGAAQNLVGRGSVPAEINFRTAGGTADIGSGTAIIKKILGKTLALNQICGRTLNASGSLNNVNWTYNSNTGEINVSGTASEITNIIISNYNNPKLIVGHKYLISGLPSTGGSFQSGWTFRNNSTSIVITESSSIIDFQNTESGAEDTLFSIRVASGASVNITVNPTVFDLTLMFGAGNEPSTVEEFEAMFPLPYYAYNPGQLVSNRAMKLKTVGFNQWDGEYSEENKYINSDGNLADSSNYDVSSYIPVLPNTSYYFKDVISPGVSNPGLCWYDGKKNYISGVESGLSIVGQILISPANACYLRCSIAKSTADVACINLSWSGVRNGEYEPYWESEIDLNLSTLTGKKDGVGQSVVVFPDGIPSAGSVQSDIESDGVTANKRIGAIDLGSMSWTKFENSGAFYADGLPNRKIGSVGVCGRYTQKTGGEISQMSDLTQDKVFSFQNSVLTRVAIKDTNFASSTAAEFKAAMDGVMLNYELAEPETYILDEPVPMNYRVDDFGTEAKEPADTEQANGVYAPLTLMVQYAMNAVDTLRRLPINYISKPSFDAFCAELATKLGAAINKNISIVATYNDEQEKYNYTITISDIEQP